MIADLAKSASKRLLVGTIFTSVASACFASCGAGSAVVSVTPVIEQDLRKLGKAKKYALAKGHVDVLIIGDSMAERWAPYRNADFPGLKVINHGISGEKTQELLWRIRSLSPAIDPSRIILITGTNNFTDRLASACEVSEGVSAVAKEISTRWPDAHLFTVQILPRGKGYLFRTDDRAEINAKIRAASPFSTFTSVEEDSFTCHWTEGECPNYHPDRLHLARPGYIALREALDASGF